MIELEKPYRVKVIRISRVYEKLFADLNLAIAECYKVIEEHSALCCEVHDRRHVGLGAIFSVEKVKK